METGDYRQYEKARAWAEISIPAIVHNARLFEVRSRVGMMAVLKADAYGHGAIKLGKELEKNGISHFCVASLSEAVSLRKAKVEGSILILGYTPPEMAGLLSFYRLCQAIVDEDYAAALQTYAGKEPVEVHVAVDTGMHRLGISWQQPEKIEAVFRMDKLKVTGLFSHLCVADSRVESDRMYTFSQFERFDSVIEWLHQKGFRDFAAHIQSSYGVINYGQFKYDFSRIGIALYGVGSPSLVPAMTIKARIARVSQLEPGDCVGYGRAFTAVGPMQVAVVTIGYADGLPRNFTQTGQAGVLIHGHWAPVIGRICMDQMFVDVTGIQAAPGDMAVIMGSDGGRRIDVTDIARWCGTISNEILSRLGRRLERIYI